MIPKEITAGDTIIFSVSLNPAVQLNHPIDTYNCLFVMRGVGQLDVQGTHKPPNSWDFVIPASQSEVLLPGRYAFRVHLEGNGERHPIIQGNLHVYPNLASQGPGYDDRTQTQKWLDQVNEAIQTLIAGGAIQELAILGRTLRRYDLDQLIQLKKVLEAQLAAEMQAQGKRNPYRYIVAGRITNGYIR